MEENTNQASNLTKAKEEIEKILKENNAILVPIVVHQGDRTFSRIDIAPAVPAEAEAN
jgi:hypothetical protein